MDLLLALLIVAGLRHPAPAVYHAPVKALPLVVQDAPTVLDTWTWGTR
jgi:hypothetical protein